MSNQNDEENARGGLDVIRQMILEDPDFVHSKIRGYPMILHAVRTGEKGNYELAQLLLEHGADPNVSALNSTPMGSAAAAGQVEMVELLLRYHADINPTTGVTPLYLATLNKKHAVMKLLLERGADPQNTTDENGLTAPATAVMLNDTEAMDLLLRYSNVTANDCVQYFSEIPLLSLAIRCGQQQMVRLLIQHGADVNKFHESGVGGAEGSYPLHAAVFHGQLDILSILLKSGAKMDQKCRRGLTPFQQACFRGDLDMIFVMMQASPPGRLEELN